MTIVSVTCKRTHCCRSAASCEPCRRSSRRPPAAGRVGRARGGTAACRSGCTSLGGACTQKQGPKGSTHWSLWAQGTVALCHRQRHSLYSHTVWQAFELQCCNPRSLQPTLPCARQIDIMLSKVGLPATLKKGTMLSPCHPVPATPTKRTKCVSQC